MLILGLLLGAESLIGFIAGLTVAGFSVSIVSLIAGQNMKSVRNYHECNLFVNNFQSSSEKMTTLNLWTNLALFIAISPRLVSNKYQAHLLLFIYFSSLFLFLWESKPGLTLDSSEITSRQIPISLIKALSGLMM